MSTAEVVCLDRVVLREFTMALARILLAVVVGFLGFKARLFFGLVPVLEERFLRLWPQPLPFVPESTLANEVSFVPT